MPTAWCKPALRGEASSLELPCAGSRQAAEFSPISHPLAQKHGGFGLCNVPVLGQAVFFDSRCWMKGSNPRVVCRVKVKPRHTPPAHVSLSRTSALYRCKPEGIINRTDVRCIYWTWTANIGKPEGPGADLGMCAPPRPLVLPSDHTVQRIKPKVQLSPKAG